MDQSNIAPLWIKSKKNVGKLFATPTYIPNRGKNEGDKGETRETPGHAHLYLDRKNTVFNIIFI
jgi:hypothetical protein